MTAKISAHVTKNAEGKAPLGLRVRVRGAVQGVGFRPTVWRMAHAFRLVGDVLNDGQGVLIHVWGRTKDLDSFLDALQAEAPPLARIESLAIEPLFGAPATDAFKIVKSAKGAVETSVVPDAAACPACLAEIFDGGDRRRGYAFTNCTHCGPRFSIIRSVPYDRPGTSMAKFVMCPACSGEYEDPGDRRFHAQPNACADCGPRVWLEDEFGEKSDVEQGEDAIAAAAARLQEGLIVAVKGLGGFHLACDALDAEAVRRLRARKRRFHKPFAIMARDGAMVGEYADLTPQARELLVGPAAPIVVLPRRSGGSVLAPEVAPGQDTIGFMLPYTPLHHLLLGRMDGPIVLTSGNVSDEPQCVDNDEARRRLRGVADRWLMHDRDIVNRLDDSVVRLAWGKARMIRRARGFAPAPLTLHPDFASPSVLAMGGELKAAFCLIKDGKAVLSQHMGDLEDALVHQDFRKNLGLYRRLFDFRPEIVAVDKHPGYFSSQWGKAIADAEQARLEVVQHHHAHVAACLAEYGAPPGCPPALGIALDGLGAGDDGTLWGGEFLLADMRSSRRLAHFAPVRMPGGAHAVREPWRNLYAHLVSSLGWDSVISRYARLAPIAFLREKPLKVLDAMMLRGVNAPPASSAGRLFDAAAAAIGVCVAAASYEGQGAVELEALAGEAGDMEGCYGYEMDDGTEPWVISWAPLWRGLLDDLICGAAPAAAARRFHNTVAAAVAQTAMALAKRRSIETIVISGGVTQNRLLLENIATALEGRGFHVLAPEQAPANDGGLALGQAAIAAARALQVQGASGGNPLHPLPRTAREPALTGGASSLGEI